MTELATALEAAIAGVAGPSRTESLEQTARGGSLRRTPISATTFTQTLGELDDLLPWLTRSGARHVQIERVGLRAVYDRYHGPMEREVV